MVQVGKIQRKSDPCQWRHIPGKFNVVDDVSCGIEAENLEGRWTETWCRFPIFTRSEWPQHMNDTNKRTIEEETAKLLEYRNSVAVHVATKSSEKNVTTESLGKLINCKNVSSSYSLTPSHHLYVPLFIKKLKTKCTVGNNQEN